MPNRLEELRLAFMVMTRLPVGQIAGQVPTIAQSAWAWPIAGIAIGGIGAAVWGIALSCGVPVQIAAVMAVTAGLLATGGIHEDGLGDLADGFGGGRDKVRALEIMRDSRIGSYGALAIAVTLIWRVSAISSLDAQDGAIALIALATASRAAMPLALWLMPAARTDGLGQSAGGVTPAAVQAAIGTAALALLLLGVGGAVATATAMAVAALALAWLTMRKIGGQTGDVLGALQLVSELAGWTIVATIR